MKRSKPSSRPVSSPPSSNPAIEQPTSYRTPTAEQIAARSRELWIAAGRPEGRDVEFWLTAERSLLFPTSVEDERRSVVPPPPPLGPKLM